MAREEHDREDLLAEATALVERVSLQVVGGGNPIVIGFRRDQGASFYFTAERVYHFTSAGELRRAYVDDRLVKAERGQLVALRRQRTAAAVTLVRHELSAAEAEELLAEMRRHFATLDDALSRGQFTIVGQVPQNADVMGRIRAWQAEHSGPARVARSPRAG